MIYHWIEVTSLIKVTSENIDDIMCTALEGGINYWCSKVEVKGKYYKEYAYEQIAMNGVLILHDIESGECYELTIEELLNGIKLAYEHEMYLDYGWCDGQKLDCGQIDAEVADVIIQYAIFADVIYG